jgi:hypothetical protein
MCCKKNGEIIMSDKYLEELKKKLDKMVSSDDDKKKLDQIETPQQAMQFVSNFGIKLDLEMKTRSPQEANKAQKNLIDLNMITADFLKNEKQQMQMNKHWEKILQLELDGTLQYNAEKQKGAKKEDGGSANNEAMVVSIIQRLEGEARRLEGLQRGMMSAPGQQSGPAPKPDSNLIAKARSVLPSLGKMFSEGLDKKLEKAEARVDSASANKSVGVADIDAISSPFSMKPRPPTPYDKK